jgi:polyphosphate kinase 2 (PPK2 family)
LPERGRIGIFNRSYYEEVLIVRVHPDLVLRQRLPEIHSLQDINDEFWEKRYQQINRMEEHLVDNGTIILKFFLNVSKKEQKARFMDRINDPDKNWKFTMDDVQERNYWDDYQHAFEEAISATNTETAPWYIIPADHKWYMRTIVGDVIVKKLNSLPLKYPEVTQEKKEEIRNAKKLLESEN